MAKGWRYIAQRITGDGGPGEFLDLELPLKGVQIKNVLSGHNSLNATITPEFGRLMATDGEPLLDEYGTAIWAEAEGEIRGGGIVTRSSFNGPSWTVECTGLTGLLIDQPYVDSWFGVEIDPLDVVRHIWEHWQSKPGGNVGMQVDALKTGLKIGVELEQVEFDTESGPVSFEAGPVKLAYYQTHNLAGVIDQLANETPFDYRSSARWSGDQIVHRLELGYPQLGRRRTDLRFVIGENINAIPAITRDGADYASEALVLGAGEGRTMIRGSASRPVRKLRRVAVVSDSSLRSLRSANAMAKAEMAWRNNLDTITALQVRDTPSARLGSVHPGDEILVQGRTGWRDLDTWVRVLAVEMTPETGNSMSLQVVRSDRLAV